VHLYICEGGDGGLHQWLRALDLVAELHPRAVVAGHKNRDLPDDPVILDQTRQYLRDVIRILKEKPTPEEFFEQVIKLYPDRLDRARSGTERWVCFEAEQRCHEWLTGRTQELRGSSARAAGVD
jgi:hypothetical protein